ncbi:MAG: MBL fold metallo-hydrolase [Lachnospiraceae bacterium]|nr:MBL fold metallo-hydrolase [Lachnospiraceae bacterium]
MKITENVHLIRNEFQVTPQVKRYVNLYLIEGKSCYLIDSGVTGSERLIEKYLNSIGKTMSDIRGVFLTHSHPDHIGGAAELKRITGCKIYAPLEEMEWIENIDTQFKYRPIPNFYGLLSESVKVDVPLRDGDMFILEDGIQIKTMVTPGHSHGSMSFVLNDSVIFTGDAIPVANDLPIFVDYEQSIYSLDKLSDLSDMQYFCPAWDEIYDKKIIKDVIDAGKAMLHRIRNAVQLVEKEYKNDDEKEKLLKVLEQADILQYAGNPLVVKSIEACRKEI